MKRKTPKSLKVILWKLCIKITRLRDNNTCQKCGREAYLAGAHTSHVFGKGAYPSIRFDLLNLKVLCTYCHRWWHSNPTESGEWFKNKFSDRYKYLLEAKNKPTQFKTWQLEEKVEEYGNILDEYRVLDKLT